MVQRFCVTRMRVDSRSICNGNAYTDHILGNTLLYYKDGWKVKRSNAAQPASAINQIVDRQESMAFAANKMHNISEMLANCRIGLHRIVACVSHSRSIENEASAGTHTAAAAADRLVHWINEGARAAEKEPSVNIARHFCDLEQCDCSTSDSIIIYFK